MNRIRGLAEKCGFGAEGIKGAPVGTDSEIKLAGISIKDSGHQGSLGIGLVFLPVLIDSFLDFKGILSSGRNLFSTVYVKKIIFGIVDRSSRSYGLGVVHGLCLGERRKGGFAPHSSYLVAVDFPIVNTGINKGFCVLRQCGQLFPESVALSPNLKSGFYLIGIGPGQGHPFSREGLHLKVLGIGYGFGYYTNLFGIFGA